MAVVVAAVVPGLILAGMPATAAAVVDAVVVAVTVSTAVVMHGFGAVT